MAESVLVTGATGLIGAALVRKFAAEGRHVYAAVRNVEKARAQFGGMPNVEIVEWNVVEQKAPAFVRSGAVLSSFRARAIAAHYRRGGR